MNSNEVIHLPRNMPNRKVTSQAVATEYTFIKKLIWAYFLLLLFEGALRKWFLPSLSQGLLIIRDPIVIWIYFLAYGKNILPLENIYIKNLLLFTLVFAFISFFFAGTHWATVGYGIRTNLLHFPLIFVMGKVLTHKDVIILGKAIMILALPMTLLLQSNFRQIEMTL